MVSCRRRGADQRDGLAFRHLGREVLDHRLLRIVAEAHVVELHVALHVGGTGGRMVGLLLGRARNSKMRSAARPICSQHVGHLRELGDGCVKFFTYWMNAWMSPTVMMPCTARKLPAMATAT